MRPARTAIFEKEDNDNELARELRILKTHNGGGVTWTDSYLIRGGEFSDLTNDSKQFWISGLKYEHLAPVCYNPLVLSSEANGEKWAEDSLLLNAIERSKGDNLGCTNHAALALSKSNNQLSRILVSNGIVYEKTGDKIGWKKVFEYQDDGRRGIVRAFGQNSSNDIWLIEGNDNEHGILGRLVVDLGNGNVKIR